jgi:hypothetical protein
MACSWYPAAPVGAAVRAKVWVPPWAYTRSSPLGSFVSETEQADALRRARIRTLLEAALATAAGALGVAVPPLFFHDELHNAVANHHAIWIDPEWVTELVREARDPLSAQLAAVGVLAHELGHHIDPLLSYPHDGPWQKELRADRIAGRVLATVGAAPDAFVRLLGRAARVATRTHPPARLRVEAVFSGYADVASVRILRAA